MAETKSSYFITKLKSLQTTKSDKDISLKSTFDSFGPLGHYLLILFMILPFLQPVPLMGLSTPFGLMIAVLSFLSYFNKAPWLPKRWSQRAISKEFLGKVISGTEKIFNFLSRFIKERWPIFFKKPFDEIGTVFNIINAVLLALPLPIPFSNALPAWAIFFFALAKIEKDGLFVLISYLQTLFCYVYFLFIWKGASLSLNYLDQFPILDWLTQLFK
jgi:hypothetical protein